MGGDAGEEFDRGGDSAAANRGAAVEPHDAGRNDLATVGERVAGMVRADVDVEIVTFGKRRGGGKLDAQAGRGNVLGLPVDETRARLGKDLHRPGLAYAQSAAAFHP